MCQQPIFSKMRKRKNIELKLFCGDVSLFLSLVKRTAYYIGGFHLVPPQSNVFCSFFSRDFYISQGLKIYLVICNNTKEISHGNPRK